jgi:hypothetical protein
MRSPEPQFQETVMTNQTLTPAEQRRALDEIARRIAALDWTAPVAELEIDRLHASMPTRQPDEPLADWLRRGFGLSAAATAPAAPARTGQVLAFVPRPDRRAWLVGQTLALAAAGVETAAPPLPETLRIGDGAFAVELKPADGTVRVAIQALGRTLVRLRKRDVAICGPEGLDKILAILTLGPRGDGRFEIPDTQESRRLLLGLQVWEIEPV